MSESEEDLWADYTLPELVEMLDEKLRDGSPSVTAIWTLVRHGVKDLVKAHDQAIREIALLRGEDSQSR